MKSRQLSKRRVLPVFVLLLPAMISAVIYNSDRNKIAQAVQELNRLKHLNIQQQSNQARLLADQLLETRPRVFLFKSEFNNLIDQIKLEKINALLKLNMIDQVTRILDELKTGNTLEQATEIKKTIDDQAQLNSASALVETGKWFEAEKIFLNHLNHTKFALPHRLKFHEILMKQGRNQEARQIYADGIFALDHPEDGLLELAIKDNDEILPEKWAREIELFAGVVPDDPRIQLALANLEHWRGHYSIAQKILENCLNILPDDQPTMAAVLKNKMAMGDASGAWIYATKVEFSQADAFWVAAWFCNQLKLPIEEEKQLLELLKLKPWERRALSRLAELGLISKNNEMAKKYQDLKKEAENRVVEYYRLCRKASPVDRNKAFELQSAAAQLGLVFDSRAWGRLAAAPKDKVNKEPTQYRKRIAEWISPELISRFQFQTDQQNHLASGTTKLQFQDVADQSGLSRFIHLINSDTGQLTPPLSSAGGVGLIDFNNDGLEDVFAIQSGQFPPDPAKPNTGDRLFQNLGSGQFEDVTTKAGIDKLTRGFGHGVAVGDVDNDGFRDLFITRWRSYALWRNRGDGTFEDVTIKFGLAGDRDWPTSAAFADLDNDGDLDLYVCHYMEWIEGKAYPCIDPKKPNSYDCRPRDFPALKDHLFRNDGGKFTDVSEISGVAAADTDGRGLGVVAVDVNEDGLIDIFVANDTTANFLFINRGKMQFEEAAFTSGVAANAQGGFQAGMGVAAGDLNGDGLVDLAVTNFYNESTSIFQNLGGGFFADRTTASGVAAASRSRLGFGILFADFDNNGFPDILTANGHVTDGRPAIAFRMPLQLFQNQLKFNQAGSSLKESQLFRDVTTTGGEVFSRELMARGLVVSDLDGDGRLDAVVQSQGDALLHLKNQAESNDHWIEINLVGVKSNRDAIGARLTLKSAGQTQKIWQTGGGSFQSAPSRRLHVGLGEKQKVDFIEIQWPSGQQDSYKDLNSNKRYRMTEGSTVAEALK